MVVRDLADGKELRRLPLGMKIHDHCSGLSPDGLRLLTGHDDNSVRLWGLSDGGLRRQFHLDTIPTGPPAFSPNGRFVVAHSFRDRQYFWVLPEPEPADRADSLARKDAPAPPAVAPSGPSPLEAARLIARSDRPERAIPVYEKELKERPGDPHAWVEYGRLLAVRGQTAEADAAFVRAARLAPDDFQPYFDQWWIVGPYAYDVRAMEHPQNRPDPSRPVPPATRTTAALPWRVARAGHDGVVDLAQFFTPSERISAYALTYLYTQEERELTVSLSADDFVRVWLNGKLVFEHIRGPALPGDEDSPSGAPARPEHASDEGGQRPDRLHLQRRAALQPAAHRPDAMTGRPGPRSRATPFRAGLLGSWSSVTVHPSKDARTILRGRQRPQTRLAKHRRNQLFNILQQRCI